MAGPVLDARERRLLLLLGAASFFNQYDQALLALLLVQIQESLAIPEASLGTVGSLVRLGAAPAVLVLVVADRIGRRRTLLATITGYTLCTAATALVPGYTALVACQLLARVFMTAEILLAMVVVVEELRPHNRGLGIGLLGTLAALGHGAALLLFGFIEHVPFGWRGLYGAGVLPLLVLGLLRRRLPETRRFALERPRAATGSLRDWIAPGGLRPREWMAPVRLLWQRHPARLLAVCIVAFVWGLSNAPVDFFLPKYLQEVQGWQPERLAATALLGGALGLSGHALVGWLSDRHGRRPAFVLFSVLEPLTAVALYTILGPATALIFVVWTFCSVATDVVGDTYGKEIFPTAARSTAAGLASLATTLGGAVGLALVSLAFPLTGSYWPLVKAIALAGLAMPIVVLARYPETAGRSLEELTEAERKPEMRTLVVDDTPCG